MAAGWRQDGGMDRELAERMLEVVRAVPAGRVVTYGDVAARAGTPSPRLAGWVLANLADESVPWHRVVRADGRLAAHLAAEQAARLAREGVPVRDGRVDLRHHRDDDRP
jgi:alkylated DNA nucleotide flippase Atl1